MKNVHVGIYSPDNIPEGTSSHFLGMFSSASDGSRGVALRLTTMCVGVALSLTTTSLDFPKSAACSRNETPWME